MFRHYNLTKNQQTQQNYHQILNKSDTKVLLYGRRDKLSIQTNRHIGGCCINCQKCPKYVHETGVGTTSMLSPELKLDIANNNNSSKFVDHLT